MKKQIITVITIACFAVLAAVQVGWAAPEKRIALVIGNGTYKSAPLDNPVNDAKDMARVLEENGFFVEKYIDANRKDMLNAVRSFGDRIKGGGVGLFFYAGHGLQVNGENYLVPVDADMAHEDEVEDYCIKVSSVLRKMETAGNRLNIIILDACRNNPYAKSFRSGNQGLAKMDAPTGSLLAYATAPGSVASDGQTQNGLYTSKLLEHMKTPGLEIGKMFRMVRADVLKESAKKQVPWESSSLTGEFYFVPTEDSGSTAKGPDSGDESSRVATEAQEKSARDLVVVQTQKKQTAVPAAEQTEQVDVAKAVGDLNKPAVKEGDRRRVAILYFDNSSGRSDLDALRKGLADMMITDLSRIKLLNIVERDKLEEVLKEQNLQGTKQFDASTAVDIGKLLGAEIILVGAYFEMISQLRIDARMVDVETGRVLKSDGVNGRTEDFFRLKDKLVWSIAKGLDSRVTDAVKPQSSTDSHFDSVLEYSKALELYDNGDKEGARKALTTILEKQPGFKPAEELLAKLG